MSDGTSILKEFLFFRKMITPVYIQFIFWVLLALIWLVAFCMGVAIVLQGGAFILLGPIVFVVIGCVDSFFLRIGCELAMVAFKIHSELVKLNENTGAKAVAAGAAPPPGPINS